MWVINRVLLTAVSNTLVPHWTLSLKFSLSLFQVVTSLSELQHGMLVIKWHFVTKLIHIGCATNRAHIFTKTVIICIIVIENHNSTVIRCKRLSQRIWHGKLLKRDQVIVACWISLYGLTIIGHCVPSLYFPETYGRIRTLHKGSFNE